MCRRYTLPLLLLMLLLILLPPRAVLCLRQVADNNIPLKSEQHAAKTRKFPGCSFGGEIYELGDTWNPSLGEPFGVMYCVHCECLALNKKRRIVGRVSCRNIKHECPKPTCDTPVLLPGQCCKRCIEEDVTGGIGDPDPSLARLSPPSVEVFFVLLTGSSVKPAGVTTSAIGRGHITMKESTLHFSIVIERLYSPISIQFHDDDTAILYEHLIETETVGFSQICGVWEHVPAIYRRALESGNIHVVVTSIAQPDGEIAGQPRPNEFGREETFSSILHLQPSDSRISPLSGGALAMASLRSSQQQDSLGVIIAVRGLFDRYLKQHDAIVASVVFSKTEGKQQVIKTSQISFEPQAETIEYRWEGITHQEQRWLARGHVTMTLTAQTDEGETLAGSVTVHQSCKVYRAALTGSNALLASATGAGGVAAITMAPDGAMLYRVHVTGLSSRVTAITIEGETNKPGQIRIVTDVLDSYIDGWAEGVFRRQNGREVAALQTDQLFVNVATKRHPDGEIRGRIVGEFLNDHTSELPVPLTGSGMARAVLTGTSGTARMSVDDSCVIHYELQLHGTAADNDTAGWTATMSADVNGHIGHTRTLAEFKGNKATGIIAGRTRTLYAQLNDGLVFVEVSSVAHPGGELRGQVRAPNTCEHKYDLLMQSDVTNNELDEVANYTCMHHNQYHEDGASWPSSRDPCVMCSCQRGQVVCDPIMCPTLACEAQLQIQDGCCPTCADDAALEHMEGDVDTSGCYFEGDKTWHAAGTSWHPYIPPFGFSPCALCTCRVCRLFARAFVRACVYHIIKKVERTEANVVTLHEEGIQSIQVAKEVHLDYKPDGGCSFKNEYYGNGDRWHPRVQPFGSLACVLCRCKDGHSTCRRQKCPKLKCPRRARIQPAGECCAICTTKQERRRSREKSGGGSHAGGDDTA
ncbi:PREDICTED: chordin-like [Priapulus caudatus]|uniref:Chordin-like n=1 Tax=Priapulus caudatus TaxID=37621 RepID=A0ABM1DYA0_PRICU|nr:PREDICTED: chordin-like [Priapulus caudatus]